MAKAIKKEQNRHKPGTALYQVDSKQREKSFATRKEADDFKVKFEHDTRASIFIDPKLGDMPFSTYAQSWLSQHAGAVNTKKAYGGSLAYHINPAIGDLPLRKISRERMRTLLPGATSAKPVGRPVVNTARPVITYWPRRSGTGGSLRTLRPGSGCRPGRRVPGSSLLPRRSSRCYPVRGLMIRITLAVDERSLREAGAVEQADEQLRSLLVRMGATGRLSLQAPVLAARDRPQCQADVSKRRPEGRRLHLLGGQPPTPSHSHLVGKGPCGAGGTLLKVASGAAVPLVQMTT